MNTDLRALLNEALREIEAAVRKRQVIRDPSREAERLAMHNAEKSNGDGNAQAVRTR